MSELTDEEIALFIGARIKRIRTLAGVSQAELAQAIGVKYPQIQKFERGANDIKHIQLYRIAQRLHRPIADFMPREAAKGEQDIATETALASTFGARLTAAFTKIDSDQGREAAAFLVEAIAEAGQALPPKRGPRRRKR